MNILKRLFKKNPTQTTTPKIDIPKYETPEIYLQDVISELLNNNDLVADKIDPWEHSITDCFKKHFALITSYLAFSPFSKQPIVSDLFVVMASTLDFIADYYSMPISEDRDEISYWFVTYFHEVLPRDEFTSFCKKLDDRESFYKRYSQSGTLRGDFLQEEITDPILLKWPPFRYNIIFCDCLNNPKCLKNYETAPVLLNGIFEKAESHAYFKTIRKLLTDYESEIKKFTILY